MGSTSFSCARLTGWAIGAVVLQILGLSLFVLGFFPVKPTLHGVSGSESYQKSNCNNVSERYDSVGSDRNLPPEELRSLYKELSGIPPVFDRLIVMVIDGLPAEFVLGRDDLSPTKEMMESMPYTQALISSGNAIGFHAKAAPPTVTMPRLKAIVSGAIGGFLDVAFNFNTQAFHDDSLLAQLSYIGWKMIMLGDETWIKLFPDLFTRQDGVTSFFVKDTVEVDFNVSRHLKSELSADDWNLLGLNPQPLVSHKEVFTTIPSGCRLLYNILLVVFFIGIILLVVQILHYLGLDHVGHIGGRHCNLMAPKLKEMDEVIEKIYTSVILDDNNGSKRTLLMVISDHGMTDNGNHGGSSYEETDSVALFISLGGHVPKSVPPRFQTISQVDIVPTLALLFSVPIPKNNVGVVLLEILDFLTDEQKLRALELNSWQLLKLLQAQLPDLPCGDMFSENHAEYSSEICASLGDIAKQSCQLYLKAADFHNTWNYLSDSGTISNITEHFVDTVSTYREFLETTSKFLSHKATDKPIVLLAAGIGALLASSLIQIYVLLCLFKEKLIQRRNLAELKEKHYSLNLDEFFIMISVLLHLFSLGGSSMVEEEQYTWHFFASTLYLIFLYMNLRALLVAENPDHSCKMKVGKNTPHHSFESRVRYNFDLAENRASLRTGIGHNHFKILCLLIVLICGRILRGWHQGGVNWSHLPDISTWLQKSGASCIKTFQIASLFLTIILSSFSLLVRSQTLIFLVGILMGYFLSGLLILLHVFPTMMASSYLDNSILEIFYVILLMMVITVLASPWFVNLSYKKTIWTAEFDLKSSVDCRTENVLTLGIQGCSYLIGAVFTSSWCLLQLLLQHPLNAMPMLLLLLQMHASCAYFIRDGTCRKQWVEVAAMYFLGMAGHFSLGNSNSIATIDVAGAFTGLSSHSMVLSGILMFVITHASSLLLSFGMIMPSSGPDNSELIHSLAVKLGFRCFLPLILNSITLTSFTIILLIMRNHLFVWSVFSPKYLYICAATLSVYVGISIIAATYVYVSSILFFRIKMAGHRDGDS